MDELVNIINLISEQKGGTPRDYRLLADLVGYIESQNIVDRKQTSGGPGRGIFQFEKGENASAISAIRRAKNFYKRNNQDIPKWIAKRLNDKDLDASTLTKDQQTSLFFIDKMEREGADFSEIWSGKKSVEDFWLDNHWAGKKSKRAHKRAYFRKGVDDFYKHYSDDKFDPEIVVKGKDTIPYYTPEPKSPREEMLDYVKKTYTEFDPEGSGYDYESAKKYNVKPDGDGHWPSRVPETGQLLKGKQHETFFKTEEAEQEAGNKIFKSENGRYYSQPELFLNEENEFAYGGDPDPKPKSKKSDFQLTEEEYKAKSDSIMADSNQWLQEWMGHPQYKVRMDNFIRNNKKAFNARPPFKEWFSSPEEDYIDRYVGTRVHNSKVIAKNVKKHVNTTPPKKGYWGRGANFVEDIYNKAGASKNKQKDAYHTALSSKGFYDAGSGEVFLHGSNLDELGGTNVHETMHATGLDDFFNKVRPVSNHIQKVNDAVKKKYGESWNLGNGWTGPILFREKESFLPIKQTEYSGLHKDFLEKHSYDLRQDSYMRGGELYPRIMQLRYNEGIKPGQWIKLEDVKKLRKKNSHKSLFEGYKDEDIQWMLNTYADNSSMSSNEKGNIYAYGGAQGTTSLQNEGELSTYDSGGTHQQNPIGGIPIGMGQNGKMNTVEEGEASFESDQGRYIFSNRIYLDGSIKD